jgi:hypothetical protein
MVAPILGVHAAHTHFVPRSDDIEFAAPMANDTHLRISPEQSEFRTWRSFAASSCEPWSPDLLAAETSLEPSQAQVALGRSLGSSELLAGRRLAVIAHHLATHVRYEV